MSVWERIYQSIEDGTSYVNPSCPFCEKKLKAVLHGLPDEDFVSLLDEHNILYELGGCLCYGDDRDADYYCGHCRINYAEDLIPLKLMECALERSIFPHECRDYITTQKHYIHYGLGKALYKDNEVICNHLCPAQGKRVRITTVNGEEREGILRGVYGPDVRVTENYLSLESHIAPFRAEWENIPLREFASIELLSEIQD